MRSYFSALAVVSALLLFGCGNPINMKTASNYTQVAQAAARNGDWEKARMYYGRALTNAQLGHADAKSISVLHYEYGRASGVICDWVEAEKGLTDSLNLDRANGGPFTYPLAELARMNHDRGKYEKALEYYNQVMPEFEKMQADTLDPLGYALILREYATSLDKTGSVDESRRARGRADELERTFPGKTARTDRTPYGAKCKAGS